MPGVVSCWPVGYVDPDTGRVAVLAADLADSDLNGDVIAYWRTPGVDDFGLDPWRLVDGIDRHTLDNGLDVCFENGTFKAVDPDATVFLRAADAARLANLLKTT